MGWNCPACLNGDLASPTHQQASPRLVSPVLPPSLTPPPTCSDVMDSPLPLPLHPPILNTYPLSAFTLPFTPPPAHKHTTNQQLAATPSMNSMPPLNLRILQWNAGGLSPSRHAELIAFLSNNQYDLFLLQETHFSATKNFQIPGYSTLHTDWTFARQGLSPPEIITPVVVSSLLSTLTWPSLLFLSLSFFPALLLRLHLC